MPSITQDGPIWTLNLGDDENRFGPEWLTAVEKCLDELEAGTDAAALVTIGSGKFYSNGLDLDWLGQHLDEYTSYVDRVHALFARVLTLPVPTVAALNGHAFGAGAMLAMAHDYRIMRDDRGYLCFPEVDIHIPFTPGMSSLITSKLTPRTAVTAMTTGHRYPGPQALQDGLVDAVAGLDDLQTGAADIVRPLAGKDRKTLGAIKQTMFTSAVAALQQPMG
ncbi:MULTISPECIES: enoyl-CoA hydratase/isomerase family protein [unclassified Rhodococcus (in: high G+C Gram-positive bacteria)]|uniref:enoyl-CoA hydratase/isomerase family protein n=1 Tax=unclassified Rhodococcus (in: high G+C Gram-positive bacteria) TaxID=192944 RepID=UPI00146ABB2D|nr:MULTISPECIES: enoyl-CoA hydratase/isomerase family protein [unclassified Rhodococcus (in: high G+C Gram-positive bacteria)]NMD97537.1 enoyl-CoA hydratase/isomerase family protein [Rhodococcus sp. BL-253-APC-6A1W]NME81373.1 enoyl-CoA hydratase/isomerase family protein [Rhodococcus sp. 105337]